MRVLFVCLGNICRSPTAEAVFRFKAAEAGLDVVIESAGTGGWHAGEPPDPRARATGEGRGYSFEGQTARAVRDTDFSDFDHILAMDRKNLEELQSRSPKQYEYKIKLFLDYSQSGTSEVPDPYYGGPQGFDNVLDLIEDASAGLITTLK